MFDYDLIIIWSWSAWLPAWMYASRYKVKNLVIWALPWWALATSHKVENYPGVISASGKEIMDNFANHAVESWSELLQDMVNNVEKIDGWFLVKTWKKEFKTKFLLLATWNKYRRLWVKWEEEFLWRWVSYCATCDWNFFKNMPIVMVWWGNTAVTESLYLAEIASEVHLVHRKNTFRAEDIWVEKIKQNPKIKLHLEEEVEEVAWDMMWVSKVVLKSGKTIEANWFFVAIWSDPDTKLVDGLNPEKDEEWCLIVDKTQKTSVENLYAAWDVTTNSNKFKQTIMSAAEWCLAANSIHEELLRQ